MRLRERAQVAYTSRDADLDGDGGDGDDVGGGTDLKVRRTRVKVVLEKEVSDDIEDSESEESGGGGGERVEVISDDSSNLEDEVPLAKKMAARRVLRRKVKARRRGGDEEEGSRGKIVGEAKDLLLKYLRPNVSNVEDRRGGVGVGNESDSDDVFDEAPPSLQAGRRKRKVVAHPRGSSLPVSSDDSDDDEDDRPLKKRPTRSRNGSVVVEKSSRSTRQSKVSYKDPSSSDEEEEGQPPAAARASHGQPETSSEVQDEDMRDAEDKDFADFDVFAFTKSKNPVKRGALNVARSGVNCYTRLNKVQSKMEVDTPPRSGSRRLRRLIKNAKRKDDCSADGDLVEASQEVLPGQRRSLRCSNVRNLKGASSSDAEGGDSEGLETKEAGPVSLKKPRHLEEESEVETRDCSEAEDIPKLTVVQKREEEPPRMLNVGVYGIEGDEVDEPVPIAKRIGRVEKILSMRKKSGDIPAVFCVKEYSRSYRDVVNVHENTLLKYCPQLVRNFLKRLSQLGREDGHCLDRADGPAFDPLFTKIDRIIAHDIVKKKKLFLVKWCRLTYTEATWEKEESLTRDRSAISRYHKVNRRAPHVVSVGKSIQKSFKDGRSLRDYQEAGVTWLDHNFENRTNCVLADEMGLGKTIQSVAMLETLRCKRNFRGPFLVIAPVSTLGHWQREIETLTDMNCVVYTGNQEDRDIIRQHEFHFNDNSKALKFNVLLTSFEMLMRDQNKLAKETWQYIVVDEAHRLKSKDSKTTQSLRQLRVRKGGLLLLTGTPVQNNTKEIFSLLNLLDPEKFNSEAGFLEMYGEIKDAEQIKDLQENILRPRLLRRMKEDVEKSIPQKEETIVWVELTKDQRAFYKAIFENNVASLLKGSSSSNLPNLRNVAMELRKVCNHPFLCDGLEDSLVAKYGHNNGDPTVSANILQSSSGKMVLVDKLLPKLKDTGRRVLIFSQFTIMLDLLEDYMTVKGYSYERIDGKIRGSERQAAIDRYSAKDSDVFVFLLSTRAGGLGITLTAADTCIIYDSDWNPQNDLQAMARCHRIGQTKDVKIYRLITRNTYEERLFECSSRKYGLDEAILGNRLGADVSLDHDKNIESLLKHGAYDIMKDESDEAAEFNAQDIDQILEQRTQQRQIGGRGNNTFSVATFKTNPEAEAEWAQEDSKQDSKGFWQEIMPEACDRALTEALVAEAPADLHPGGLRKRTRGRVNYRENVQVDDGSSDEIEDTKKGKQAGSEQDGTFPSELEDPEEYDDQISYWSEKELKRLEDRLFALGRGRTEQIRDEARLGHRSPEDIEEVSNTLIELCHSYVDDSFAQTPDEKIHTSNVAGPLVSAGKGEKSDTNSMVIPASVKKLLESQGCKDRLQRNAQRYLQQLHERKVLAEALQIQAFNFMDMPLRAKKLPSWWGQKEDVDLLRGVHIHGHKDFKKIRSDTNLAFADRNGQSLGPKGCENGEHIDVGMPSDQVLGSRLKHLIEALPNGLTAHALQKRARKNEASRKSKAKLDQRKLDEAKKPQPIMSDKNLAEWVTSKSSSSWNAEVKTGKPMSEKAKLKVRARESKKTTVVRDDCSQPLEGFIPTPPTCSFQKAPHVVVNDSLHFSEGSVPQPPRSVVKSQPDDLNVSPRKPLLQNNHREVESGKSVLEKISPQKRRKVRQENEAPKKRKLSLSAGKSRQLSLKSFLKSFPVE